MRHACVYTLVFYLCVCNSNHDSLAKNDAEL